jgi:hypothetical protein
LTYDKSGNGVFMHKYLIENTTSSVIQNTNINKQIKYKIDILGRETKQTNQTLFYLYDDGTVEKRIVIE